MEKIYTYTGLLDKNGNEVKVGDIIKQSNNVKVFIEVFGSKKVGSFTYRPLGATSDTSSYYLDDLKSNEIEIVGTVY